MEDSLRAPDAFVLRRAQIILARARGETAGAPIDAEAEASLAA